MNRTAPRLLALLTALLLAGCSSAIPSSRLEPAPNPSAGAGAPEILPIIISSEIVPGRGRFLFSLTDGDRNLIASPELSVRLELFAQDGDKGTKLADYEADFLWAIKGERGVYVAYPEFPASGRYGFRFLASRSGEPVKSVLATFDVAPEATTPAIGAAAISSDTPTASDVNGDLTQISTDESPDPAMYEVSIAQALEAGEPFVVTFATPKLCTSRVCGPTLETVKAIKADYPRTRFIHVEPYDLRDQSKLKTMPWIDEWGLPSEPWVFVVDGDGTVSAKFEVIPGEGELRSAIDAVVGS